MLCVITSPTSARAALAELRTDGNNAAGTLSAMDMSPLVAKNILLTGPPGCGKTTIVRRVVDQSAHLRLAGFYTRELRDHGSRRGFEAIGLRGNSVVLAHVDFSGRDRVGRYGVDVAAFEKLVQAELSESIAEVEVFVIDEIGKMECLSDAFIAAARRTLTSSVPVLATVAARGGGFICEAKARKDVEIVAVTLASRDELPDTIVQRLRV